MDKEKLVSQMEKALESAVETYNQVGNGDITFSEAGDRFHTILGDETITALQRGLEYLKEEK